MGLANQDYASAATAVPAHLFGPGDAPSPASFVNCASPIQSQCPTSTTWRSVKSQILGPAPRGRKRSRDEGDAPDVGAGPSMESPLRSPPRSEPRYGPGMTLIRPNGLIISAASQTGTWAEEAVVSETLSSAPVDTPPRLVSRKSQRLNTSSPTPSGFMSNKARAIDLADPTLDASTVLGIGWSNVTPVGSPSDPSGPDASTEAAIRGWTRFIAKHYPLTSPTLLLRSQGLAAYVVRAAEGYFLFDEDLSEARLIGRSPEAALDNLRRVPVSFVSDAPVLRAAGPSTVSLVDSSHFSELADNPGRDTLPEPCFAMELD
ncbi:MAG: hypothetical protein M1838_003730 [Thelocarpon superellum]|nr:MAG: hypothetical protein M1838_003730 [Thelocarpon superellum]